MKVRSFLPNLALSAQLFTTASMLLLASTANAAITVYTTQASFDAATSAPGVDGYSGFLITGTTPSPITRSAGAYSYQAAAPGNYFGAGTPANPWLSTFIRTDTATFDNFPSSVRGVGGLFFTSDSSGAFAAGNITVAARDSSGTVSQTIVNSTAGSYLGFVSTTGMLSLTVTAVQTGGEINRWATIDDLRLAQASFPVLSIVDSTVLETSTLGTDTSMVFTLNLSAPAPAGGVSGTFSTSDGVSDDPANSAGVSQAGGNDYASQTNVTFSIPAGATSGSVSVPVRGDITYEFDEDFRVTLNAAGLVGATLGTSTAQGLIENDDSSPTVVVNSPSVIEGTGPGTTTMTFNLSLDGPTQRNCNFGYESFADAAAQGGGVDFDDVPSTQVNLTGASQTATVNVNIIRDALVEPNETFQLDIFGEPNDCDIFATNAVGTIIDDDSVSTSATLSIASETATETNSDFVRDFAVTRSNSDTAFSVSVSASANTASLGSDFTVPFTGSQVLNFAAGGALSQTIAVTIVGDTIVEPTETFALNLSNVSNTVGVTTLGTAVGTGTILDDDVASVSVNDVNILEGNSGSSTLSFTVTRTAAITMQSVQANVIPASASPGSDYTVPTPNPQTLSFAIGELTKTIDIAIIGDRVWEANETLAISLSATTGGLLISDDTGIGTISNDDVPVINISSASITEGNGPGTSAMNFTLTAADPALLPATESINGGPLPGEIRVNYRTVAGSALNISDFIAVDSFVTMTPSQRARSVTVQIVGDTVFEPTEEFTLETYSNLGFTIGTPGTGTILDNDAVASVSIASETITETNSDFVRNFTVTRSNSDTAFSVSVSASANTATLGSDFTVPFAGSQVLNFAAGGALSQTIPVTIVGDTIVEPTETFALTLSNLANTFGVTTLGTAVGIGTILDDDVASVSVNDVNILEGNSGSSTLSFTVTRTAAITMQSVQANVSPASASPGSDYTVPTPNPQTLLFAIGELTKTVSVAIIGERVWEADETLAISLSVPTGGLVIGDGIGIGTITNDDFPVINVSEASITEGDGPGTTAMNFTVTAADPTGNRTPEQVNGGPIPGEIRVGYRTINGSAVSVGDFLAVDSNLTFSPGQRARNVSVQIVGDTIPELTEQFTLETYPIFDGGPFGPPTFYTIGTSGIGTILDNDSILSLSINDISVLENAGSATLTVTASSAAPVGGAQVDFTTVAGTALAGSDFTARSGTVTIAEGATSASVVIAIVNDGVPEAIESLIVRISNARGGPLLRAVNYSISKADGVITINDDDTTAALAVNPATLIYGQATTLTATIACGSTPTGTVAFNSGASSLGSAALIAGATVGTATATLNLPLLNAGGYSAVANYAGAGACGSASSPAVSITVNPAATTLALSGPARSRINQPTAFSGALSIVAPGAGAVAGTIMLTSAGSAACSSSAAAVSSCNLSWNTLGAKTIIATFTPSTGNYLPSTSNILPTFVFALADLDVSISNQVSSYQSNDILLYTLILNNRGPDFAPGVRLRAQMPSGLFKTRWTCTPIGGAICPQAGGVADIDALVQTLPANGQLIYMLSGVVITPTPLEIRATAAVTLPSDGTIEDPVLTNQSATDVDAIDGMFRNGFED